MFLRIVIVRSTEQSGIKGVKIPFDPNILYMIILPEKQKSCTITCVRIISPRHLKFYRVLFMK